MHSNPLLRFRWTRTILTLLRWTLVLLLLMLILRDHTDLIRSTHRLLYLPLIWSKCTGSTANLAHLFILSISEHLILLGWVHEGHPVDCISGNALLLIFHGVWSISHNMRIWGDIVLILSRLFFNKLVLLRSYTVLLLLVLLLLSWLLCIGIHHWVTVWKVLTFLKLRLLISCDLILLHAMLVSELLSFWHLSWWLDPLLLTHSELLLLLLLLHWQLCYLLLHHLLILVSMLLVVINCLSINIISVIIIDIIDVNVGEIFAVNMSVTWIPLELFDYEFFGGLALIPVPADAPIHLLIKVLHNVRLVICIVIYYAAGFWVNWFYELFLRIIFVIIVVFIKPFSTSSHAIRNRSYVGCNFTTSTEWLWLVSFDAGVGVSKLFISLYYVWIGA